MKVDSTTADDRVWEELVKNLLRAEMTRRGVSYATLVGRLAEIGVADNELNLRNKVSRGRFTAVFLMQCLLALGVDWMQVPASLAEASGQGAAQGMARQSNKSSAPKDPIND